MSAPAAIPSPETSPVVVSTARAEERRPVPWLAIAVMIAVAAGLLLVLSLVAGVVLRSSDYGLGTGFGLVPFVSADAGVVVAVVGLVAALAIALSATWRGRTTSRAAHASGTAVTAADPAAQPPAGFPRRNVLPLALGLALGPCALFLAGLVFVSLLRRVASPVGYSALADLVLIVLGLLMPVGIVAAVVVLVRGSGSFGPLAAAGARAGVPERRRRWTGLITAAAIAVASLLFFLAVDALGLSYGVLGDLIMLGAAAVAVVGVVAAVIVALRALLPGGRTTSLRTRAFFVIAIAVLIPSLCLAALGVWAYYRSWETATNLSIDQARYRAGELATEVASVERQRNRLTPAERARVTGAIARMYGVQGHQEGAQLATLAQIRQTRTLPGWAIKSLERRGYAIGTEARPAIGEPNPEIVAWRVGPRVVRYYVPVFYDGVVSAPVPVDRLLWIAAFGVALIVVLGVLGAWLLSRSVVRPVRRLAVASGRLAEGEAGVTVTPEGPRELRDLAASFNDMNAKLTKAQETEQAFLLSVSHELKTPLTSVRGYAEGVGDGTVEPDVGAAVIGAESSRLERLVGDLLDSARMRKSAFTVRCENVDLATLAQDVARRYEGTAQDAGLTLYLKTDAGGSVTADNDRVLQVVSNLVENAIRCTPPPGSVTITTAPGAITVADTGRGLTSDDLPRAFERFYLYSRYGNDRPVGTGLGLAIVKELTEAMGGTVSVSSAVGVGTAFTVTLPQASAAQVTQATVTQATVATPPASAASQDDAS